MADKDGVMASGLSRPDDIPESGRATAEDLCGVLDDALLRISRSKCAPEARKSLAELTSHALRAVYAAIASSHEAGAYRDAMVVASMQIDEAIAATLNLAADPEVSFASDRLSTARELAALNPLPARAWRFPGSASRGARLPASVGVPRVLDLSREVVMPVVPLAESPVEPVVSIPPSPPSEAIATLADLDALLTEAEALPAAPAPRSVSAKPTAKRILGIVSATDALVPRARELLEELGVLGGQRRPAPAKPWSGQARFEQRLLARVDALVACGEHVLPVLVRSLERRPVPDPELTWALVFLHGVVAGDDSLDEALRLVRAADLQHPALRDAVADALVHLPSVRVEARLRPWLDHSDALVRSVAVTALGRRGALLPEELASAAGDKVPDVVRAAASVVGRVPGGIPAGTLDELLYHEDDEVVAWALAGAAAAGHAAAAARARTLVRAHRGEFGAASLVYSLCAGRTALDELLENAAVAGGARGLQSLGWFGHLDAVPFLAGRVDADDPTTSMSAARALQRITGLSEPSSHASMSPRMTWGSPLLDGAAWRSWWQAEGLRFDRAIRYRHGAPWSASTNVAELRAAGAGLRERELSLLELRARVGLRTRLELDAFVAKQDTALDALEDELRVSELPKRGWPVTLRV